MTILPQTPSIFYTPPQPLLMLAAPKVAGLLPANVASAPPPPPPRPAEIIYDDPRLALFLPWAYADLRREVIAFLDETLGLLTGESDRQQFAEANIRFTGQIAILYNMLVPADQQPPIPYAQTRAEMDADLDLIREQGRQKLIEHYERRQRERDAHRASRSRSEGTA